MRRGDLWLVSYNEIAEAGEPAKQRPAVVVSADRFNMTKAWSVIVVGPRGGGDHTLQAAVSLAAPAPCIGRAFAAATLGTPDRARRATHASVVDDQRFGWPAAVLTQPGGQNDARFP